MKTGLRIQHGWQKKKSSGSGYVFEIARSPLGIFSSNDKQSSPSEERWREESKKVQESKDKGNFFLVGGQTGEDCLPYLTDGLNWVAFVIDWSWTVIWRVPSSFFGNFSSVIFLSENAFLRNIREQAKKKKEKRRRACRQWKIWLRRYRQSFARRAAKLPQNGLWWSQNSNYSNRKQCSTYKGRKIEWLALFFSKKAISNVGKKGK